MKPWFSAEPNASIVKELGVITRRANRTWKTRIGSFVMIAALIAIAVPSPGLFAYIACLIPFEITLYLRGRALLARGGRLSRKHVIAFAVHEFSITSFYVGLGLFTLGANSISILLLGFVWLAGCLNYARINFVHWQHLDYIHVTPSAIGLLLFVSQLGLAPIAASTTFEWWAGIIAVILLLATNFELATDQRKLGRELVSAQKEAADRLEALEYSATHDDLTGLHNRASFNDQLEQALAGQTPGGPLPGIMLLDLDDFKPVNDAFGHPAGDALLSEISGRLKNTVGRDGLVARVGGDEFAVLIRNAGDEDHLEDLAQDIIRVVAHPLPYRDAQLSCGVSIGAARAARSLNSVSKIVAAADEALYRAKENRKPAYVLYTPGIARRRVPLEERLEIETAIKNGIICPFYQPKFALRDMKIMGFEALARWPLRPTMPSHSADFISKIEDIGLLSEFTYYMARQVFKDIGRILDAGHDPGQVSLNLSEVTLATLNGIEDLEWLLAENPRVVPHLTLEITEDVFLARSGNQIRENIDRLRGVGVRISLDDFGTGFASFQHLRQLEFDELKIDTEFVHGLGIDPTANVIVDGFLSIARGLNVSVVAEGVETEAQRRYLLERDCLIGQGFLHSKAQSFEDIQKYLTADPARATG